MSSWLQKKSTPELEQRLRKAAENGTLDKVKECLAQKVNVNAQDNSFGWTALHRASVKGHLKVVQLLVRDGKAAVEVKTKGGNTALHLACENGHLDVVQYLVRDGKADVAAKHSNGWTSLHLASYSGRLELVQCLSRDCKADVNAKENDGWTALHLACRYGHLGVVQYLLQDRRVDMEAKPNIGNTALHLACENGHSNVVQLLVREGKVDVAAKQTNGWTALHLASYSGCLEMVRCLSRHGNTDVNAKDNDGWTALHLASRYGHLKAVKYLVQEVDADPEAKTNEGGTALHRASSNGHLEVVRYLVRDGKVKVNVKDNCGRTALHRTCLKGHLEVVQYLVQDGMVDVNAKANDGCTALHLVCRSGNLELVRYLVQKSNADLEAKTNVGTTALHLASENGHLEVVQYLVRSCDAKCNVLTNEKRSALHLARQNGKENVVKFLSDYINRKEIPRMNPVADPPKKSPVQHSVADPPKVSLSQHPVADPSKESPIQNPFANPSKTSLIRHPVADPSKKSQIPQPVATTSYEHPVADPSKKSPIQHPVADPSTKLPIQQPVADPFKESPIQHPVADPSTKLPIQQPVADPSKTSPIQHPVADPSTKLSVQQPVSDPSKKSPIQHPIAEPSKQSLTQHPVADPSKESPIQHPVADPSTKLPVQQPVSDPSKKSPFQHPVADPCEESPIQHPFADPSKESLTQHPVADPSKESLIQHPFADPSKKSPIQHPVADPSTKLPIQQPVSDPSKKSSIQHPVADPSEESPIQQPVADPFVESPILQPVAATDNIDNCLLNGDNEIIASRNQLQYMLNDPQAEPTIWNIKYLEECTDNFTSKVLGKGAFGKVYFGCDKVLGFQFAVKRVPLTVPDPDTLNAIVDSFRREVLVLKRFRHPNIVALYGYNITVGGHCQFLVYEYLVNGALSGFLMDDRGRTRLPAHVRISIMFQVARAVHFLHTGGCDKLKILHRDIKSGNICLTQDYTAKLIDCGMSKFVPESKNASHGESVTPTILKSSGAAVFGTPGYICPNYLRRSGRVSYTAACDVYSMGVVFAELIVGCLQDGQSSRNGQDFDDYHNRYVVDEFGEKVDDGSEKLISDADPVAEWEASSLKALSELTYECMAPSPLRRPATQELIQRLGDISKTDFRGTTVSKEDAPPSNEKVPVIPSEMLTTSLCVLCHESVVNTIACRNRHTTCIPCSEQRVQDIVGRTGENLCCGIVGCNAPLTDDSLYGKISSFTFKEYVRERGLQRIVDQGFKALRRNHGEVMTSLRDIKTLAQRSLNGLAYLATESVKKCPTLVWMVPAEPIVGRSARDWVKWAKSATTHRRFHFYFVCQHSFSAFDLEPKMEIDVPKSWIIQAAPVLRLSIFAIKSALSALGSFPFPFPDVLPREQIEMAEELVQSFLDDTTTKLLAAFESACTNGLDLPHAESSQLMTLTGPAYDGIVEKATKLKRTHWKQHMVPVMNHHGTLIWVKKEYQDFY